MLESPVSRIMQRKSRLEDAGGEFLGSLSDYKLLKNELMWKFKGPARFAKKKSKSDSSYLQERTNNW